MGKANSSASRTPRASAGKARSARERVAAQRAQDRRSATRRRALTVGASLVAVLAVVLGLVIAGLNRSPAGAGGAVTDTAVAEQIASVPPATFDAVGAGTAAGLKPVSGLPELTMNGKPEVLYMGGEFCPYCAAERWAIAAALSRFGTLSGIQFIHSSPTDAYPSTPTLSFASARYTSKYVAFVPVELYSAKPDASTPTGYAYLQQPTSQQASLLSRYTDGAIPFVDIGNRYVVSGAQFLPSALAGLSWAQVASAMHDPNSPVARDIDGAADMITAAISKLTHGQPAGVSYDVGQ
jgi:hypothetical protein